MKNNHTLKDCFAVWYTPYLVGSKAHEKDEKDDWFDHVEEICEQGWADYHLNGINKNEAKVARSRK